MSRFLRLSLLVTGLILIIACGITANTPPANTIAQAPPLTLAVQAQPNTYTTVGQTINYTYLVSNTGTSRLEGQVTISDNKMIVVACQNVNEVGNTNGNFDVGESVTCRGGYSITQADINNGSMTNTSTATIGGQISNTVNTTIQVQLNKVLTVTVSAAPSTYNQAGQVITYNYSITNTGAATLGPAQFVVKDDRIPTPTNCGADTTTLATNQSITCSANYTVTQSDLTANAIVNNVSASGAGAGTIQSASTSVTNTNIATPTPNIARGSTVQHNVTKGDWMLQIARCYGANYKALKNANPQVTNPNIIFPTNRVTVPNVGSEGPIYGPPCMKFHKVVSGDSWQSIANQYNADMDILIAANPNKSVTVGTELKVPLNSKQSGTPYPGITVSPTVTATVTATPTITGTPTVTFTPSPTGRPPIPLNFPAGSPSTVTQQGNIGTPDRIRYVFNGTAGQTLSVRLTVPSNDVQLAITGPNNTVLKQLDLNPVWTGTLLANGEQTIELVSTQGASSKTYTLEATLTTPKAASPTEQAADINPGSGSSNPSYLSAFNGQLYFQADGGNNAGPELWRYDPQNKAVMVKDINPGSTGSDPAYLKPYTTGMFYFGANGDSAGNELWRFNGTDPGRVLDLFTGPEGSNPKYLAEYKGLLYFSARGSSDGKGTELYRFDPNTSQATLAADINAGPGNSDPSYLAEYKGLLYFSATTTNGGTELWKFDGTTPSLAADINPSLGNSNPSFMTVFGELLYFSANGGDGYGTELWRYDGTNPPVRVTDINAGGADAAPTYLTVYKGALYFSAIGDSSGFELWKFDGTNASRITDINPTGNSFPSYLAVYGEDLYFQANANNNTGTELWKYRAP